MGLSQMQIGEVAERTGLSLRTIRCPEAIGRAEELAASLRSEVRHQRRSADQAR